MYIAIFRPTIHCSLHLLHYYQYPVLRGNADTHRLEVCITKQQEIRGCADLLALERGDVLLRAADARRGEHSTQRLVHLQEQQQSALA